MKDGRSGGVVERGIPTEGKAKTTWRGNAKNIRLTPQETKTFPKEKKEKRKPKSKGGSNGDPQDPKFATTGIQPL